jgi:hypothetical protein
MFFSDKVKVGHVHGNNRLSNEQVDRFEMMS